MIAVEKAPRQKETLISYKDIKVDEPNVRELSVEEIEIDRRVSRFLDRFKAVRLVWESK